MMSSNIIAGLHPPPTQFRSYIMPKITSLGLDYSRILPVLFLEYLVVSLARSLVPSMIVESFGAYSYLAVGIMETMKGLLAFVSSPLFGKLSDIIGENYLMFLSVKLCINYIFYLQFRKKILSIGHSFGNNNASLCIGVYNKYVYIWNNVKYFRFLFSNICINICIYIRLC